MHHTISSTSLIRFENVSKRYGSFQALRDISFEIKEGETVGFLGPNGAGKTTAMRVLSGFFPPTSGRVWIRGVNLFKQPQKAKRFLGYLPESVNLYPDMRVVEYLGFVARLKGVPSYERKLHVQNKMILCGLVDVESRLIGRLSKGYRQRVGIAQALIADPSVLILDEPTTGLDPQQITQVRELIRAIGHHRAVILSTHILPEVSMLCNRVLMIHQGRILASGTVNELEAFLKDREVIHIMIKERGHMDVALQLLASIPKIEDLKASETSKKEIFISFKTTRHEDLRPKISKLLVENGISLIEIQRVSLTLEDIFLGLLKQGKFGNDTGDEGGRSVPGVSHE